MAGPAAMMPWLLVGLAVVVLGLTVPVARGAFGEMPEPPVLDDPPTPVDDTPALDPDAP
ncbi:hypothetical protein [Raineyella sp. W15-4]|uniref:hypothetical protein n=1 Tax=Raineyella sp. W15-4 TaxID=3081651 RepID=UPI00295417F8|nr:hypothetical protein [Raineyella sp. W15-4]WOQ15956.1 hypothetical protein R0145_12115 [Raineyella sp. W15-4]